MLLGMHLSFRYPIRRANTLQVYRFWLRVYLLCFRWLALNATTSKVVHNNTPTTQQSLNITLFFSTLFTVRSWMKGKHCKQSCDLNMFNTMISPIPVYCLDLLVSQLTYCNVHSTFVSPLHNFSNLCPSGDHWVPKATCKHWLCGCECNYWLWRFYLSIL